MKLSTRIITTIILAFVLLFTAAACGQNGDGSQGGEAADNTDKPFLVGVIPSQNKGNMEAAMEKLAVKLEEGLGRPVDLEIFSDYNGVVEAMKYDKIDMAYYGPLTYVIVNHEAGAQAVVTQLIDGEPFYYSYIIVPADSPLNSFEDLVENSSTTKFAFGDINSTSGSLVPSLALKEQGVFTDQNNHKFAEVTFTGSHDITALSIENKKSDAGAIDSAIYDQLVADGKIDGSKIKVIWKSEELFQYPWAVTKNTDAETIQKLQDTFLAIDDPEILSVFGADGFIKASDSDYESVRKAAKEAGRIK
jgi:phosphonate transport system substrate-binding protein